MIYAIHRETKEHRLLTGRRWRPGTDWLTVEADADGWIPRAGGECPLPDGARCDVKHRDGEVIRDTCVGRRGTRRWAHTNSIGDIMAYRPILDAEPNGGGAGLGNNFSKALATMQKAMHGDSEVGWDGESWPPPIGAIVESTLRCFTGNACEVLAVRRGNVIACDVKTSVAGWVIESETRPIRTPDQRAEDEAVEAMATAAGFPGCSATRKMSRDIYAAIRDGKIPGVKLDVES